MAHPPWHLSGELLIAWCRRRGAGRGADGSLPDGVRGLPGPALLLAASYSVSPVGPFVELAVAEPARLGLRPGLCVTTSVVAGLECRVDYRLNWGLPAEAGTLLWEVDAAADGLRKLTWLERGIVVAGRPGRLRVPGWVPVRGVQHRSDGAVLVPRRVRGWLSLGLVDVRVPDDDEGLAWAAGPHFGAAATGMRMVVDPARHPLGLLSSLRAPLQAPGTGLTASAATVNGPRAYGSVG